MRRGLDRRRWLAAPILVVGTACGGSHPTTPPPATPPSATAAPQARPTQTPTAPPSANASAALAPTLAPSQVAPPKPSTAPAVVATLRVPRDRLVHVVLGNDPAGPVIVYLHGRCGDPEGFAPWADVAREFGTLVSLEGDVRCKGSQRTRWSYSDRGLADRIERALEAVRIAYPSYPLAGERIVIGYSAGALRAESLLSRYPDVFSRGILIAGPRPPRDGSLRQARAALLMAGELDVRSPIVKAAGDGAARGERVSYIEIPGARHGEYGPRAVETMRAALGWVLDPDASGVGKDRPPATTPTSLGAATTATNPTR